MLLGHVSNHLEEFNFCLYCWSNMLGCVRFLSHVALHHTEHRDMFDTGWHNLLFNMSFIAFCYGGFL